jgi:alkyl hydroperoxide reductase subunit AhpF
MRTASFATRRGRRPAAVARQLTPGLYDIRTALRCFAARTVPGVAIFRPDEEARVREYLAALERPVGLLVAHGPEETPLPGARDVDFGAETERVVRELAELSEHLTCRVEVEPEGFERYPAVAILPDGEDAGLRYYGLPWGYELASLVGAVLEAGKRESSLSAESLERLAALERDVALDVFVTPT